MRGGPLPVDHPEPHRGRDASERAKRHLGGVRSEGDHRLANEQLTERDPEEPTYQATSRIASLDRKACSDLGQGSIELDEPIVDPSPGPGVGATQLHHRERVVGDAHLEVTPRPARGARHAHLVNAGHEHCALARAEPPVSTGERHGEPAEAVASKRGGHTEIGGPVHQLVVDGSSSGNTFRLMVA